MSCASQVASQKQGMVEAALLLLALDAAGLSPALRSCQRCGNKKPTEAVVFDAREGGWHCVMCHQGLSGTQYSLAARLLPVVRFIIKQPEKAARINVDHEESKQILIAIRRLTISLVDQPVRGEYRQVLAHG